MNVQEQILRALSGVELANNVTILYACESGSRAWGFASKDSDWDIRFIYVRPLKDYLTVFEGRDVIEIPTENNLDVNGWDLKKALKLLYKYNPSLMEWIRSPKVYVKDDNFYTAFRELSDRFYSKSNCKAHYYHMAKGNYSKHLAGESVSLKKYLYVLRPLVANMWIDIYDRMPPTSFLDTLKGVKLSPEVNQKIFELLLDKMVSNEALTGAPDKVLNQFIEARFYDFEKSPREKSVPRTEPLDEFFIDMVKRYDI